MSYHVADRTNSLDCLVITVADVPIMVFVGVIEEVVVCTGWSSGSCRRARCRRQPVSPSSSPTWRSALTYQFDQPGSDCHLFTGSKYVPPVLTTQRRPTLTPDRSGASKASCKPRAITAVGSRGVGLSPREPSESRLIGAFLRGGDPLLRKLSSIVINFSPMFPEHCFRTLSKGLWTKI